MSKKRKREPEPALLTSAGIYDKLADESEEQRMGAAHTLLKDFQPKAVSIEQIKVIITRLFRGLCSSRKAARLGFSVALTEYLVELSVQRGASVDSGIPASQIIDILDNETTPEGNNSGQDERDHYFGRLFGAEAVIKSNILVKQQDLVQWKRLLDLICGIANKKPWLKQECGWILYNRIKSFAASDISIPDDFVLDVMEKLTVHKLIRTPEGLAIWLEVSEAFPDVKLPKQVWKHRDPLSKKDISLLADVLKDAKTRDNSDEEEHKSQGKAIWSAQLHFAWDVVLLRLYQQVGASSNGHANGSIVKSDYKSIDLNTFWVKAVEESLFASTSSPERKHWGLLLLRKVLIEAPEPQLRCVFTKNAMTCLMNALKDDDRYLQRTAQKVVQSLRKRAEVEPDTIAVLLEALLVGAGYTDFDAISKTKTVEKLLNVHNWAAQLRIVHTLDACFRQPGTDDARDAVGRRRQVVALQGKMLSLHMSRTENVDIWTEKDYAPKANPPLDILHGWIDAGFFADDSLSPVVSTETRELIKSRLVTHLEQALKTGKYGKWLLQRSIFYLLNKDVRKRGQSVIDFDETVRIVVEKGFDIALSLPRSWDVSVPSAEWSDATSFSDGLLLLFCMTFLQIYNSDTEAVEILEDLIAFHQTSAKKQKSTITTTEDQSDALVEILLSFASKQSKFLRRMTNIIFEGLAPQITSKGLKSLVRILATKENVEGQQEMFDAADEDVGTEDNGDSDGSDVDMLDSDVEIIGASHSSSTTLESDNESDTEDTDDQGEDEELAAFDAKLAAALGTRKMPNGVDDDDDSSSASGASDTDMDDDQMMVLDDKLAEVFRARQQETSKKREKKDAKETIVNFKNRVLDLIEVYLKVEYLASQSLDMILPLLHLARKTKTKQLADRACNVLNEFCKRCKGVIVPACNDALAGIELLLALHTEAGTGASNAHANAASHASILVVKSLVNSGVEIGEVVDVYAETQKRMLTDKKCKVQAGLFTDWNNWCVSVKERFAE